jgi:hypothetical protein
MAANLFFQRVGRDLGLGKYYKSFEVKTDK